MNFFTVVSVRDLRGLVGGELDPGILMIGTMESFFRDAVSESAESVSEFRLEDPEGFFLNSGLS